jgi:hypothetical protein
MILYFSPSRIHPSLTGGESLGLRRKRRRAAPHEEPTAPAARSSPSTARPCCHLITLFYEYFHGDNGAGLSASHQTGWTGIIARVIHLLATSTAEQLLKLGKVAGIVELEQPWGGQTGSAAPSRKR